MTAEAGARTEAGGVKADFARSSVGYWPLLVMVALVGLIYVSTLAFVIPVRGSWAGDQGAKIVLIESLARNRLASMEIEYPGSSLDPPSRFSPLPLMFTWPHGDQYYSIYSYPYAALTVVPFVLLGTAGLYVIPVAATMLAVLATGWIARRYIARYWWLVAGAAGLATPVLFYALVLWEHALSLCLAAFAFACALKALDRGSARLAALGGVLVGIGFWMRPESLWFGLALALGLAVAKPRDPRLAVSCGVGLAIGTAPLLAFNALAFGPLFGPDASVVYGQGVSASPFGLTRLRGKVIAGLLFDYRYYLTPVLGVVVAIVAALSSVREKPWLVLAAAALASADVFIPESFYMRTGLIASAPILVLAIVAPLRRILARPEGRLILATSMICLLGVLLTAPNDGGAVEGPRYLLPIVPLLLVVSALAAESLLRSSRGVPRFAVALAILVACASSLGSQVRSVYQLRDSASGSSRILEAVGALDHEVVLTDVGHGPQILGPIHYQRKIFLAPSPAKLTEFSALLGRNGISSFSYLTGQDWGRDEKTRTAAGVACTRVADLSFLLTLFDCRVNH